MLSDRIIDQIVSLWLCGAASRNVQNLFQDMQRPDRFRQGFNDNTVEQMIDDGTVHVNGVLRSTQVSIEVKAVADQSTSKESGVPAELWGMVHNYDSGEESESESESDRLSE